MKYIIKAIPVFMISSLVFAQDPIVLNDFEANDYGAWETTGTAFGDKPANGTLPGQMHVDGFRGKGLVNSFLGGDNTTGRLTSPAFTIHRKFITFLIGGGGFANETCMNLVVDGKTVRTATGTNRESGGSERLSPAAWDVSEFIGRNARLIIVDERIGGWGHINVDHIVLTNDRSSIPLASDPPPNPPSVPEVVRKLRVSANFLQLPLVKRDDGKRPGLEKLSIEVDGKLQRYMHVEFSKPGQEPDFWYSADLNEFRGQELTLRYKSTDSQVLERLRWSDQALIDAKAYQSVNRPQFHFSPRVGWMNDINGTYYQDGLFHVFYQFNPATTSKGAGFDMHWGHSVSKDLVHWEEWPVAIFPNADGQCYSGTTVMQVHPIQGLNEGLKLPAPVIFFAATNPFSQHIATSSNGGRTWNRFKGNPVVPNMGNGDRDPKVIWHEPSQHYVMILYVGDPDTYRVLRSKDLIHWEQTSVLPNWFECPEFLPVKSAVTGEQRMMLYGCYRSPKNATEPFHSNSCYQLGNFDGQTFTAVTKLQDAHLGPNYYGALTFMNAPNNRCIMMGWARGTRFPGELFNQCASVPLEMQIRSLGGQDKLCFEPVPELNVLRGQPIIQLRDVAALEANAKLTKLSRETASDVVLRVRLESAQSFDISIRNIRFSYDAASKSLKRGTQSVSLHPDRSLEARFLIDRGIVECFWNQGEAAYCLGSLHTDEGPALALHGNVFVEELTVYPLKNIWQP